ncbi:MAG: hypothetical protein CVU97_04960 [Firmicutes bacterium HGW-Firmicutes-21]|nr:MAG: hypothetical protein CVU97_04960 [Firmicutes bacterium HGW-Firmicutes-21]
MCLKKFVSVLIIISFLLTMLVACERGKTDIELVIGGISYNVNTYNTSLKNQKVALFDRLHRDSDGSLAIVVNGKDGYTPLSVYTDEKGSVTEFVISEADKNGEYIIPTNGFLAFFKKGISEEISSVEIKGYTSPEYIELPSAALLAVDGKSGVPINYRDCEGFPEDNINILMQPSTVFAVSDIPENLYAISIKRKTSGIFSVEEIDVKKYGNKYSTVVFGNEYSIAYAKKLLTLGMEFRLANTELATPYGDKKTLLLDNNPYRVNGINTDYCAKNGVYVYNYEYTETAAPICQNTFIDMVVINGIIMWKGEKNERAVMPGKTGYIIRFSGVNTDNIPLGTQVKTILFENKSIPLSHVKINDVIIEVGYYNTERTAEPTGFIYNSDFYSLTTCTNIWGLEIAVSGGVVVEVNPANQATSGNTAIPQDGFVISIGSGNSVYSKLGNVKVGDNADFYDESSFYSVNSIPISGVNAVRRNNNLMVYNSEYGKSTLTSNIGIELSVDKNGFVTAIYEEGKGNSAIPTDGGFILSALGAKIDELLANVGIGSCVFYNTEKLNLYIVETPETALRYLKASVIKMRSDYDYASDMLFNIDYDTADDAIGRLEKLITEAEEAKAGGNTTAYADMLTEGTALIKAMEYGFIPSLTVQNRAAWVTVAEERADGGVLVHIYSEEDVVKYVDYAKRLKLNTLVIDGFAVSYSLYKSDIDGVIQLEALNGFDVIESFVRNGHKQGIEIHILVCAFSGGSSSFVYPEGHYMNKYRDKYLLTNKGNHNGAEGFITLNPFDEEIRQFQLDIFGEIVQKYDIDGIQIDYIRFPLPIYYQKDTYEDFGYNDDMTAAFKKKYGVNPIDLKIDDNLWEKWCSFRRDVITTFVEKTYKTVKALKADINLSFTCFADYTDRQIYIFQDVERWCVNGWVDELYPMIYAPDTESQLFYAAQFAETIAPNTHLTLGVGAYVRATHKSMTEQSYMSYELATDGIGIFTLRYISTCGYFDILSNGAFKKEAVRTDKGAETLNTGVIGIIDNIDNVYKRFYTEERENLDFIKELLDSMLVLSQNRLNDKSFPMFAAEKLIEIKSRININDKKLSAKITADFDYLIGCFIRTANINDRNSRH